MDEIDILYSFYTYMRYNFNEQSQAGPMHLPFSAFQS